MSMLLFSTSSIHSCSGHLFLFLPPSPPPQKHKMTGRTGFPGPPTPTSWTCECVCVWGFSFILPYRQQQSAKWMPWLTASGSWYSCVWKRITEQQQKDYDGGRGSTKCGWKGGVYGIKNKAKKWHMTHRYWNERDMGLHLEGCCA